jgi:hypothetical protein
VPARQDWQAALEAAWSWEEYLPWAQRTQRELAVAEGVMLQVPATHAEQAVPPALAA